MEKTFCRYTAPSLVLKWHFAFANIFMAKVETDVLSQSGIKLLVWKRLIEDVSFPLER